MKKKKTRQKKRITSKLLTFLLVIAVLVIGFAIWSLNNHGDDTHKYLRKEWSKSQMDDYWSKSSSLLSSTLYVGKWRYQELGDHMTEISILCKTRYGKYPIIIATYNRAKMSDQIVATSRTKSGQPTVILCLPSLLDREEVYKQANVSDCENQLNDMLVATILHEIEHMAYGYMAEGNTFESTVDAESHTWAITCEKVIEPLVQHGEYIPAEANEAYKKWLECNRNVNNPDWSNWISQTLAHPK